MGVFPLLSLLLLVFATVAAPALQVDLSSRDVDDAVLVGQTRIAADRARFHAPYRVDVRQAPVDYVDVVTPFRRIALAAEQRLALGDRSFGQRQGLELLAAIGSRVDLHVELTFHPLNTYIGVPDYGVTLSRGATLVPIMRVERVPRFGPRVDGQPVPLPAPAGPMLPGGSQPMLGGTLIVQVDAARLAGPDAVTLVVREADRELARARIDLVRLR